MKVWEVQRNSKPLFISQKAPQTNITPQEELKKIDALEPKLPMLQLLCQAHHFFPYQRDQIFHLLQVELAENPLKKHWAKNGKNGKRKHLEKTLELH